MTKESRRHPSHAPRDPSEDDAKTLVRRFGCCERGWTRVWNVDVEPGKTAQGASGGKRARQILLREGRKQSRTKSYEVVLPIKSLATAGRPTARRGDSGN